MNKALDLYMSILRNKDTGREQFRYAADQLTNLLAYEVLQHLKTKDFHLDTPLSKTTGIRCATPLMIVPILRAGIAMVPPLLHYFPDATIGVVGLRRDEKTAQAQLYYANFPPLEKDTQVIIVDPMIATGGTGVATLDLLKERGVTQDRIMYVSMVSAPEGLDAIAKRYPDITVIVAAQDKELNKDKFIIPGLGDFGDRYFGTEG